MLPGDFSLNQSGKVFNAREDENVTKAPIVDIKSYQEKKECLHSFRYSS